MGVLDVATPEMNEVVLPTYLLVMASQPLWPFPVHEVL